jgi:hypothetical protein
MRRSVLALAATLAMPAAAQAAELPEGVLGFDAPATTTLTAEDAVRRDCTARPLPGRAGVVTQTARARRDGELSLRLRGTGDWDLAVFDRTGRLAASSAGFGADEVAQVGLVEGAEVLVQACRRSGSRAAKLTTQLTRLDLDVIRRQAAAKVQLVRVTTPSHEDVERLEAAGLDVTHEVGGGTAEVVAYGPRDLAAITRLGLTFVVTEDDLVAAGRAARAQDALLDGSPLPTGRTTYRTFADVQAELKQWVEEHKDLVKPIKLASRSYQGREIQAVEISRPGSEGRPVFTLGAVHHAREWPSLETAMEFGWDLLRNGDKDPQLARILREVRVVIMPLTNPDAYILSRGSAGNPDPVGAVSLAGTLALGGATNFKRKTCNPLVPVPAEGRPSVPCAVTMGVDPNRNYASTWGGKGSSTSPNSQSYRGPAPFSEGETGAVRELSLKTNSPVHMSIHNIAAKVLRPPGLKSQGDTTPDRVALTALGQLVSDATGYANETGFQLYDTTGTSKDWGYDALGQFAYTIELGGRGSFQGPYQTNVIDQYVGAEDSDFAGRGMREALIQSALWTLREDQTARLTGTAAPGATLRIKKEFLSETSEVCTLADPEDVGLADGCYAPGERMLVPEVLDVTMTVPADGSFTWWLNPSTRPFVKAAGKQEAYTVTCEVNGITRGEPVTVVVDRGQTKAIQPGC